MATVQAPINVYRKENGKGKYHIAKYFSGGGDVVDRAREHGHIASRCNLLLWYSSMIEDVDSSTLCKKCFSGLIVDGNMF